MIRLILRRLLLAIPVFLGITLATFALLSIGSTRLLPSSGDEMSAGDRPLSEEDARRVEESLGGDLPSFFNGDVEDQRRTIEAAIERVGEGWPRLAVRLRDVAFTASRDAGLSELAASTMAESVRRVLRDQLTRGRTAPGGLSFGKDAPRWLGGALRPFTSALLDLIADQATLRRLGGQTVRHACSALDALDERGRPVPLAAVAVAAGLDSGAATIVDIRRVAAENAATGRFATSALRTLVDRWLAAARAEALAAAGPGRDAARAKRKEAESALRPAGGLMMPMLLPRLLDASPDVVALAGDLVVEAGDGPFRFEVFGRPGVTRTPQQDAMHALQFDRMRRWWSRNALRYREIDGLERWGLLAWTRTRYGQWLRSVLTLDFGSSLQQARSVRSLVAERLPRTLLLQGLALLVMFTVAIPLGTWAAVRRRSTVDRFLTGVAFLLYAAPSFWVATLLILGLGGVFPMSGLRSPEVDRALLSGQLSPWSVEALRDLAWHCVLPVFVLSYGGVAVLQRFARAGVLETLSQPWVRAARSRGIPERQVLRRHVLRPGLTPLVTLLGVMLPGLVAGSVVVERIFGIPGMGLLAWEAVVGHDIPVVMAVVTLSAIATMLGYLVSDLLYAWVDPRVRR